MKPEIRIIRIGEPEVPFEHFDDPVEPLTEEELADIQASVKKAFVEFIKE